MSILPLSDIVLDVVNAADSVKSTMAAQRLKSLSRSLGATSKFKAELQATGNHLASAKMVPTVNGVTKKDDAKLPIANSEMVDAKPVGDLKQAHRKLEGVFVQGIILTMLSGQKGKLFGTGIAGDYWKSFMAEAIAGQITGRGGIGIAAGMFPDEKTVPKPSSDDLHKPVFGPPAPAETDVGDYSSFFQKVLLDRLSENSAISKMAHNSVLRDKING